MRKRVLRDYEVSVWTLQDDFIVVLKPFGVEIKGQLQNPKLVIKDDGTQEFNFSIPKFYTIEGQKIKNPLWETTNNGTLVQDMRKIKVILNKKRPNEAVFEFLIIKVEEKHDKDSLMCEVSCEGLAFHELGKTGYKLALEADDFINDTYQYYKGTVVNNEYILGEDGKKYPLEQPQETLNYWNNKVFKNNLSWTYEVRMNYAMRVGKGYQSNKVYEDDYISAWEYDEAKNMIVAKEYSGPKEKWRPVDLKESNVYNITQELAKAFGVFCRYEYTHDENYHITGRKVIYYNNFIAEGEGLIDITYPYTLGSITKTSDVTDLVTLLFVNTVKDNDDWNTIMDSAANKTREDYILNFNYLKEKGDLTPTQIKAIDQFEIEMYKANAILIPIGIKINNLVDKLPELEANIKVLENSIPLDDERILEADDLLNEVTNNTGIVPVTEANPKTGVIISKSDKPKDNYVNITEKGIYVNTLQVYRFFDSGTTARELSGECVFTPVYDEYGDLIQITNVYPLSDDTVGFTESYRVYMTYDYSPSFYYEKVKEIWKNRKAADEKNLADLNKQHDAIEKELEELRTLYAETMEQKELNMARFYRLMGPALREGYWAPDDYKDYGDHYNSIFNPTGAEIASMVLEDNIETPMNYLDDGGNSIIGDKFIYDKERINDEQLNYIDNFEDPENKLYYPCLRITKRSALWNYVQKHWDDFSLIFYDVTDLNPLHKKPEFLLGYRIGSKCQYAFLEIDGKPELVVMATGPRDDGLPSRQFAALTGQTHSDPAQGGSDLDEFDNAEVKLGVIDLLTKTNVGESVAIQKSDWYLLPADMLYPRIQINSLLLKTVADELLLKYNNKGLEEFKDYTVLSRDNSYYITFFPQVFVRDGFTNGSIAYTIANANTAIYLDAIQVSKENAYPKVEYEAKINSINKDFIDNVYNMLGRIANINDTESGLKNVQGYISELELALDKPQDDSVKIKNYKTKFEDLFSTIVAQTEAMQKNGPTFSTIASGFTADGTLTKDTMQQTLNRVDLDYAFAHGTLTISDTDGIWARSDDGVVAMRGGGIFTSTVPKNDEGTDWVWNTGITPQGINASLITTGQLDTNLIRIYAGDNVKFQLNASGLYAYKTVTENFQPGVDAGWKQELANNGYIDSKQYVVHNEDGLFLRLENGASVNGRPIPLTEPLDRVAISWNGLTLKNYEGKTVFCADANTGDLEITGKITATSGEFYGDIYATSFKLITSGGEQQDLDSYISDHTSTNIDPFKDTGLVLNETWNGKTYTLGLLSSGNTATGGSLLIGANGGITITNTNEDTQVININEDGISMNSANVDITGGNIKLTTSDNIYSGFTPIDELVGSILLEGGNIEIIGGNIDLTAISTNSNESSNISLNADQISLSSTYQDLGTTKYVDESFLINHSGLSLDYRFQDSAAPIANITMNSNGMSLTGSNIIINDKPIWSHENIIIMNPNLQEYIEDENGTYKETIGGYRVWTEDDGSEVTRYSLQNDEYTVAADGDYVYDSTMPGYALINTGENPPKKYSKNPDYWMHSVESIEDVMEDKADWVLIQPAPSSSIHFGQTDNDVYSSNQGNMSNAVPLEFISGSPFGNVAEIEYQFSCYVYAQVIAGGSGISGGGNNPSGILTINISGVNHLGKDQSIEISSNEKITYVETNPDGALGTYAQYTYKVFSIPRSLVNIVGSLNNLSLKFTSGTNVSNIGMIRPQLKAFTAQGTSKVPCTVYYYPAPLSQSNSNP